jgi:hypothetical protein
MVMNIEKELSFPLNKKKIIPRIFLQATAIVLSVFLFYVIVTHLFYGLFILLLLLPILIFQITSSLIFALIMLLSKSAGLIIGPNGIVDNTTGVSAGKISWDNITKISVTPSSVNSFLTIEVLDPEKYLIQGNFLSRFFKRINHTFFKSPIHISAHALDISFDEMVKIVERYCAEYNPHAVSEEL